ncbi:hypothetical protein DFJ63DRAFT_186273 [Scheffersomyces coipomensis]|uniref:uncharacterized protein n=1 Tax=Scheffersomyces coipomensis TaxID=1788519 RepID=UPI00315CB835
MTLTKYQRGEQMEGWNDCPSVMMKLSNNSSSSTSLNSLRKRRVGSGVSIYSINDSSSSLNSGYPASRTPSLSLDKIRSVSTTSTTICTTPPRSSISAPPQEPISKQELISQLTTVLELPTSMSEREIAQYKSKLTSQFEIISNDNHMRFISRMFKFIESKTDIDSIKNDIVQYMMMNEGTSGWCTPLKKIVTSLK